MVRKSGDLYELSVWGARSAEVVAAILAGALAGSDVWRCKVDVSLGDAAK